MVYRSCRNPRRLIALLLGLALLLLCSGTAIAADPSVSITVTKWAIPPLAPTDFEIEQVALHSINVTWTPGTAANITIVRYDTDGYPFSIFDGSSAYSGNGTYVQIDDVDLDEYTYYFRAWCQNEWGTSSTYAQASIGDASSNATTTTMGILDFSLTGDGFGLLEMIFLIAIIVIACWKKSWIRILLSLVIITWGTFAMEFDIKVASGILAIGTILFFIGILNKIKSARVAREEV